jgi:protein-S-isoprenylcysteine O-methyltransferase Ste14
MNLLFKIPNFTIGIIFALLIIIFLGYGFATWQFWVLLFIVCVVWACIKSDAEDKDKFS